MFEDYSVKNTSKELTAINPNLTEEVSGNGEMINSPTKREKLLNGTNNID